MKENFRTPFESDNREIASFNNCLKHKNQKTFDKSSSYEKKNL
jgi:hypothetical protein